MTRPSPHKRNRRIVAGVASLVGALLLVLGFVGLGRWRGDSSSSDGLRGQGPGQRPPQFAGDSPSTGSNGWSSPPPSFVERAPRPPVAAERVTFVMGEWRNAILFKNAEMVESIDDVFRDNPDAFLPALLHAAASDDDPRVRAFCTRVLGKLQRREAVTGLRPLLNDPSEHVRHNAAWALAQLEDVDSLLRIEHLAAADPSTLVRTAASDAVAQIRSIADGRRLP